MPPRVERELTEPVRLCREDGRLSPAAIGWARRPIVQGNLRGAWPRKKRWDYWCVTSEDLVLALTYANLDYLGIADLWLLERVSGRAHHHAVAIPLAIGFAQGEHADRAAIALDRFGLALSFRDEVGGTRLAFRSRQRRIEGEVFAALPEGHETLSVVVPWSETRFQLTSKHAARPAAGRLVVDGRAHTLGEGAFACLDFGRGVWPLETTWNWASAAGRVGARTVGLNLGGQWTDGTPSTENAIVVDGRLTKLSEDVRFEYDRRRFRDAWRLFTESGAVELRFTPFHERASRIELGLLRSEVHQSFGHFEGTVASDAGELRLDGLLGWAEEHRARW